MGFDRISQLPDSLITHILLWLPTKDSIRTSVLSTRWRTLWLNVPGLDLHSNDLDRFCKSGIKFFIPRFLHLNPESRLQRFKIQYDECNVYLFDIGDLIAKVVNRGVQYLDVEPIRCPYAKDFMSVDIYKSETLVSLKLVNVGMLNPNFVVSLPCLKIMHLENLLYKCDDPLILEKLILGCPVLEDLTLCRGCDDNVPVLRVRSQSLKRFCVRSGLERRLDSVEYAIEIDAPGLKYMNFLDDKCGRFVAKNLSSLFMINIDTTFSVKLSGNLKAEELKKRDIVCDFFIGISSVRFMRISQRTLELLSQSSVTKFQNLYRLEATFSGLLLCFLLPFLQSCANLKHLILYLGNFRGTKPLEHTTSVPRCLLSTLEYIEIKNLVKSEFRGMEVVKYFLENSAVLKNLVLYFIDSPITNQDSVFFKKILTLTKRSRKCQIIFR